MRTVVGHNDRNKSYLNYWDTAGAVEWPKEVTFNQSWKKLHAAHAVRVDIFFRIEETLIQKSRTYVAIADFCGDFIFFAVNIEG